MRKFREGDVGGRLVYAFTGSSPTAPEVIAFLRDALLVPVYEGYGSTEAGMVCGALTLAQNLAYHGAPRACRPARSPGRLALQPRIAVLGVLLLASEQETGATLRSAGGCRSSSHASCIAIP